MSCTLHPCVQRGGWPLRVEGPVIEWLRGFGHKCTIRPVTGQPTPPPASALFFSSRRRRDNLEVQLAAMVKQSIPISQIIVFQNEDHVNITRVLRKYPHVSSQILLVLCQCVCFVHSVKKESDKKKSFWCFACWASSISAYFGLGGLKEKRTVGCPSGHFFLADLNPHSKLVPP